MKVSDVIGIDVSKLTIDVRIHIDQRYGQFENSKKGFDKMCNWVFKNNPTPKEEILFVFEHTGLYSYNLAVYLNNKGISFHIAPGLEIKRSLGISRGKDDKIDAAKIARYAYRLRDEIIPYKLPSDELENLKRLFSLRNRLVKQRAGFKASLKEQKRVYRVKDNTILLGTQEKMIKYLAKQINTIQEEMHSIIKSNDKLLKQYNLITSITSVGSQTALSMIVLTAGFTKFKNWRKFASFSGIAPFPNRSGTSIKGKTKVSHLANKNIKGLLNLCSINAIQYNLEIKLYYEKKVAEGKHPYSTINAIRNKLLARIFAVVQREQPYVNFLKFAA